MFSSPNFIFAQTNETGPEPPPVKNWLATHPHFFGCVHTDLKTGESKEVSCIHPELTPMRLYVSKNTTLVISPLKQFKSGIAAKDVKCGEGLQFIMKKENSQFACVKMETTNELFNRGWGIYPISLPYP